MTIKDEVTTIAVYPGTFDPITNGHLDILERALRLFDHVIVTLAVNQRKQPLFTADERIQFIRDAMPKAGHRLQFEQFDGLLVDFCHAHNATVICVDAPAEGDQRRSALASPLEELIDYVIESLPRLVLLAVGQRD